MYIETKQCYKCKDVLDMDSFSKNKNNNDGYACYCRKCNSRSNKSYRENNKEDSIKRNKEYYQKNKERILEQKKEYHSKNKEEILEKKKVYRDDNREKVRLSNKNSYENHKEKRKKNRKIYYEKNKGEINRRCRVKARHKRETDPFFRLNNNFASQVWQALRDKKAGRAWESLVGYTLDDLTMHLESKFESWMCWSNYGKYELNGPKKWHIDHITPKSWFNYTHPEDPEFQKCWALSNLQPKEAVENISKNNKFIG